MLLALLRHKRQDGPVVVDVYSTWNYYYALLTALICRLKSVPCFGVLHGGDLPARLKGSPFLSRILLNSLSTLISPSGYLKQAIETHGYPVRVIPNPLVLDNYPFRQREVLRPSLLWVRAFDMIYDPLLAVRVFQVISSYYPQANLTMVGPDKDGSMAVCRKLAEELGLENKVRFTGRLSKPEWISLSDAHDIFLNTTTVDNTPVSVMEAMALGLPVVSSKVGGIPWLLMDQVDALLVPPGDVEAMAAAVKRLLQDQGLAEALSCRGRERASEWDMGKVAAQWREMLQPYASF